MTPRWDIRPLTPTTVSEVAQLFAENGEPGYTPQRISLRYLNSPWSIGQTLHLPGEAPVVGFFGLLRVPYRTPEGRWCAAHFTCDTIVSRAFRRKGVAAAANRWILAQPEPSLNVGMNPPMRASLLRVGYREIRTLHLAYRYRGIGRLRTRVELEEIALQSVCANSPIPDHLGAHADYARFRYAGVPHVQVYRLAGAAEAVVQVLPRQVLVLELWGPDTLSYPTTWVSVADALLGIYPKAQRITGLVNSSWKGGLPWLRRGVLVHPRHQLFCVANAEENLLRGPLSFGLPDFVAPYPPA